MYGTTHSNRLECFIHALLVTISHLMTMTVQQLYTACTSILIHDPNHPKIKAKLKNGLLTTSGESEGIQKANALRNVQESNLITPQK